MYCNKICGLSIAWTWRFANNRASVIRDHTCIGKRLPTPSCNWREFDPETACNSCAKLGIESGMFLLYICSIYSYCFVVQTWCETSMCNFMLNKPMSANCTICFTNGIKFHPHIGLNAALSSLIYTSIIVLTSNIIYKIYTKYTRQLWRSNHCVTVTYLAFLHKKQSVMCYG